MLPDAHSGAVDGQEVCYDPLCICGFFFKFLLESICRNVSEASDEILCSSDDYAAISREL